MQTDKIYDTTEIKRFLSLGVLIASAMIQVCAFWFYDFFVWDHNTTAYIPFLAWGKHYLTPGDMLNVFYGISLFGLILAIVSSYSLGALTRKQR